MVLENTNRSPGRPISQEKKKAIMEAAGQLFLEQGYANTSMDKVAFKAGVSKQTVYRHFQNKENLFRAMIVHISDEISPPMEILSKSGTMREILFELGTKFLDLMCSHDCLGMQQAMISERGKHAQAAKIYFEEGPERFVGALACYFIRNNQEKKCSVDDPKRAASHFFCMVRGIHLFGLLIGVIDEIPKEERVQHVQSVVEIFARAYKFKEH